MNKIIIISSSILLLLIILITFTLVFIFIQDEDEEQIIVCQNINENEFDCNNFNITVEQLYNEDKSVVALKVDSLNVGRIRWQGYGYFKKLNYNNLIYEPGSFYGQCLAVTISCEGLPPTCDTLYFDRYFGKFDHRADHTRQTLFYNVLWGDYNILTDEYKHNSYFCIRGFDSRNYYILDYKIDLSEIKLDN